MTGPLRHEVVLPGGKRVQVPDNANLREVFLREGERLYGPLARWRHCGGQARCGTCRVVIEADSDSASVPTPPERKRLGSKPESERLACQVHVRGPMTVHRGT